MPHLNKIVDFINDHLKSGALSSRSFQGGMFYGLAKKVTRTGDNGSSLPAIMTSDGLGVEVTPDETYPFSIYHKCLNGQFSNGLPSSGFGDAFPIQEVNNMVAIIYADPSKIKTTQEDLAFIIAAGLPSAKFKIEDKVTNKKAWAKVEATSFNNDSQQVFTGEYEAAYGLQPQSIYFSLSYRVEITADRDCVICS